MVRICNAYDRKNEKTDCLENVENEKFNIYGDLIYPVPEQFVLSYTYLRKHQAIAWSAQEIDPRDDVDKMAKLEPWLFEHLLKCFSILMHGDGVVLNNLSFCRQLNAITSPQVQAMFADQKARENVHQEIYSKMLDIADDPEYYRSKAFHDVHLQHFVELNETDYENLANFLFQIMLCEMVMFSPAFLAIMYLGYRGNGPKIFEITSMVMRDENLHYKHAQALLASLNVRLDKKMANKKFDAFKNNVLTMIRHLFECKKAPSIEPEHLSTDDGLYSYDIAVRHFEYICHQFKRNNELYENDEELQHNETIHGTSPCEYFADSLQQEVRVNLMESTSTIYLPDEGVNITFSQKNQFL